MSHNTPSWCSIWTTVTRSKTPTSEADVPKVSTTNRFADEHKDALVDNFRYDVGYNRVLFLISQGQALKLQHIIGLVSSFFRDINEYRDMELLGSWRALERHKDDVQRLLTVHGVER